MIARPSERGSKAILRNMQVNVEVFMTEKSVLAWRFAL